MSKKQILLLCGILMSVILSCSSQIASDKSAVLDILNSLDSGSQQLLENLGLTFKNPNVDFCYFRDFFDCSQSRVVGIYLSGYGLNGTLPTTIGNLDALLQADFSANYFTGTLPTQIGNLQNLELLYLFENLFNGTIPTEFGTLYNLEELELSYNQLTGTIPSTLQNLALLEILTLRFNQLTGTIPSELGNLVNLELIYMQFNFLTGTIPTEFGKLVNLTEIDLSYNGLTGTIPSEFGQLMYLNAINFEVNQLTGPIPTQFANLPAIAIMGLAWNYLDCPPAGFNYSFVYVNDYAEYQYQCNQSCYTDNCPSGQVCAIAGMNYTSSSCNYKNLCVYTQPCSINATCTPNNATYTCTCFSGFSGDGLTCTLIIANVTAPPNHPAKDTGLSAKTKAIVGGVVGGIIGGIVVIGLIVFAIIKFKPSFTPPATSTRTYNEMQE